MAKKTKPGRVGMGDLMSLVNKKAGRNVAHDLTGENPTSVKEWIPTGSRWLDSIISKGHRAGIPVGKVTEIAGLESTGKSYMAAQIAANAQKTGKLIVYFDSESAIDPRFLEQAGCDLERLMYIQASSVEFVLETVEELLGAAEDQLLFIWDSLALTPSVSDVEGDFNKTIEIDFNDVDGTSEMGDAEAIIELTYNIFQYIPELTFVSIYALVMYAAVLWITKKIKG